MYKQKRSPVEEIDVKAWKELAAAVVKSAVEDYLDGYSYAGSKVVDCEIWFKAFCERSWVWSVLDLDPHAIYESVVKMKGERKK